MAMDLTPGCGGLGSIFKQRPAFSAPQTDSLETIDICLGTEKDSALRLRMPAAYLTGKVNDERGRLAFIYVEFWLPDFKPRSAIAESPGAAAKDRQGGRARTDLVNRVVINLGAERRPKGTYNRAFQEYLDSNERLSDEFDLAHFTQRSCESLTALKAEGRDVSKRRCEDSRSSFNVYFGRRETDKDLVYIQCSDTSTTCSSWSNFRGYYMQISIPKDALINWKKYDSAAGDFLGKYVIVP